MTTLAPRTSVSRLRRIVVGVIVVAFAIAAAGGIVVLVGGELGDTAARVIGTTAVVGAFSVAVLCCAALLGRTLHAVGLVGVVVSILTGIVVIWTIWHEGPYDGAWDVVVKCAGTGITLTAALALACLLLLLADRHRAAVRAGLVCTLALFAIVVAMILYPIWASETIDSEVYPRVLGIAAILAALGAVVVPVLSLLLPETPAASLSHSWVTRIEDEARTRGVTPDEFVSALLAETPPSDTAVGGTDDHT